MNLSEKWKIKAAMSADVFKKAKLIQGIPKDTLVPIYFCLFVKTPDQVVIVHPDLETIQN